MGEILLTRALLMHIHSPPNTLLRIDEIWAFVSVDETGEGLCAIPTAGGLMPMIAADKARLESLKAMASQIAKMSGKTVKLIKLSSRQELQEWHP